MPEMSLPPGPHTRLFRCDASPEMPYVVFAAADAARADPSSLTLPGVSAMLTHDPGTTEPDLRGWLLARSLIARGGVAAFAFVHMADAAAFLAAVKSRKPEPGPSGI